MGTRLPSGEMMSLLACCSPVQQPFCFFGGHVYASKGFIEGVGDAEAEAEEDGDRSTLDMEGVGVGFSCATGIAEVTEKRAVRPMKRVVGCIAVACGI